MMMSRLFRRLAPQAAKLAPQAAVSQATHEKRMTIQELTSSFKDYSKPTPLTPAEHVLRAVCMIPVIPILGLQGFQEIKENEVRVVTRIGKYHKTLTKGFHWVPPTDVVSKPIPTDMQCVRSNSLKLMTNDNKHVVVQAQVAYFITNAANFHMNTQHETDYVKRALDETLVTTIPQHVTLDIQTDSKTFRTHLYGEFYNNTYLAGIQANHIDIVKIVCGKRRGTFIRR